MGKARSFFLSEENSIRVDEMDNRSQFVDKLIEDYFNEDIESLLEKKDKLFSEIEIIDQKIKRKRIIEEVKQKKIIEEQRQNKLLEDKKRRDKDKYLDQKLFQHNLNPIFKKVLDNFKKSGTCIYMGKHYEHEDQFLKGIKEIFGTYDEPLIEFQMLNEEQIKLLVAGHLPVFK